MTANDRLTVINVVAVSYSGATWVNLLLGAHPDAASVGEIDRAGRTGKWVCTLHGHDCPVYDGWTPPGRDNPLIELGQHLGKRVLVLNNTRRFLDVQDDPRIDSRFVWIVRDGRAVLASGMRKTTGRTAWQVSRAWVRNTKKKRKLIDAQPAGETVRMRYEDVVADPPGRLREICQSVGLDYHDSMLNYWEAEHHFIAGSPGVLSMVAREQGLDRLHALLRDGSVTPIDIGEAKQTVTDKGVERNIDLSQYKDARPDAFRDERWRKDLTPAQLQLFGWVAGRLNRKLGYEG